ncbi:hypothetical protein IEO21_05231 [Rhodonia placenta]|uniref:Uncharacterized protein n=1 Tax=Rhodonia placenta TaxID=104341 RepID=A0A8H7P2D3_9APHY|nr:hypothetical protein IEO21_05231 [Postia placenta]
MRPSAAAMTSPTEVNLMTSTTDTVVTHCALADNTYRRCSHSFLCRWKHQSHWTVTYLNGRRLSQFFNTSTHSRSRFPWLGLRTMSSYSRMQKTPRWTNFRHRHSQHHQLRAHTGTFSNQGPRGCIGLRQRKAQTCYIVGVRTNSTRLRSRRSIGMLYHMAVCH